MSKRTFHRRQFLRHSAGLVASGVAVPYLLGPRGAYAYSSANERLQIGCIGLGGMGCGDAHEHTNFGQIVAFCDVDTRRSEKAKNDPKMKAETADTYRDYRRVLDRKDIDVVSVVTVDHWHIKIAIEALMAGKHVFCQKPLTLTLEENQLIRQACQKYDKLVFQVGTQQRSMRSLFMRAVNMVQKGLLGDIKFINVGINGPDVGGPFPKVAPPPELDWDLWLGQAPKVDYIEKRCHYTYRWWYEYSGGKFTDWGAHHIDVAQWAIQQDQAGTGPVEVDGTDAKHPVPMKDGYPTVDDCFNTAHDFAIKCKFANGTEMVVTSRGDNGVRFEGTKGRMFVNRERITGKPIEEEWDKDQFTDEDCARLYHGKPYGKHKESFYRCIREGGLPISDVFSHVQSMNTCHLCTIAARLNRAIQWDPVAEKIVGDPQAAAMFAREPRPGFEIPRV